MDTFVKIAKRVAVVGAGTMLVLWLLALIAMAWLDGLTIG